MSIRYQFPILSMLVVAFLGCSNQSPSPSPATKTPAATTTPPTPVHAGEIDWQLSLDGAHIGFTAEIIPGQHSTGTTSSQKYKDKDKDITHTFTWRFVAHADGKDKYHFDMRLGTTNGFKSLKKDIEYSGTEVLVFEDENHRIVTRPKSST